MVKKNPKLKDMELSPYIFCFPILWSFLPAKPPWKDINFLASTIEELQIFSEAVHPPLTKHMFWEFLPRFRLSEHYVIEMPFCFRGKSWDKISHGIKSEFNLKGKTHLVKSIKIADPLYINADC